MTSSHEWRDALTRLQSGMDLDLSLAVHTDSWSMTFDLFSDSWHLFVSFRFPELLFSFPQQILQTNISNHLTYSRLFHMTSNPSPWERLGEDEILEQVCWHEGFHEYYATDDPYCLEPVTATPPPAPPSVIYNISSFILLKWPLLSFLTVWHTTKCQEKDLIVHSYECTLTLSTWVIIFFFYGCTLFCKRVSVLLKGASSLLWLVCRVFAALRCIWDIMSHHISPFCFESSNNVRAMNVTCVCFPMSFPQSHHPPPPQQEP